MDHADVVELIELAAVEPGGLARLAAGDTPEAAAIAGHLAGCDECTSELARTARASAVIGQAIRELPDPALRGRTLSYVREVGRDRSTAPATAAGPIAAVLVAAVAGFAVGGAIRPPTAGDDGGSSLAVVQTTMRIAQQPDAVHVALASAGGGQGSGELVYSAASGELAMAVTGLAPIPVGASYACWVEQGGQRRRIGVLYMEGADGTWAGKVGGLSGLSPGTSFGVSLVPAGDTTGTPVLVGRN